MDLLSHSQSENLELFFNYSLVELLCKNIKYKYIENCKILNINILK
jgi:hypothetical protein